MHPIDTLGRLLVHLGEVEGRKKLQKLVHILQVAGAPFSERFSLSHYGAYSSELRGELDAFDREKLLTETPDVNAGYTTYRITASDQLKGLLAADEKPAPAWLDLATKLNTEFNSTELEGISTVLYLRTTGWQESEWQAQFNNLKPHLSSGFETYRERALELVPAA